MIMDSHVYCFPPLDSKAGYDSVEEHLQWVQAAHASHHQPAMRIRDRSPSSSDVLAPNGTRRLDLLPDVNFRVNKPRGRVVWNYEGEEHTKYFLPPNLRDGEYTPFSMACEMDYAGVDMALIHTDPMLGRDVGFLAECVERFPDRFMCMAPIDEWLLPLETDKVIADVTSAVNNKSLHAIKFNTLTYTVSDDAWDDESYWPFWDVVTELGVPIFFTLGTGPRSSTHSNVVALEGYVNELLILLRWMERYPDTVCSLTHGFPWRLLLDGNRIVIPEDVWKPFQNPNCNLEVCFPVRLGDLFDFPFREVWPSLEEMVNRIGAGHLLWGSDMPFQNRFCTYTQSREWIEKYCGFLTAVELNMIMGGTAARILGIGDD